MHLSTNLNYILLHIETTIGARGARGALEEEVRTTKFDRILLDYFRFPTEYMRKAYGKYLQNKGISWRQFISGWNASSKGGDFYPYFENRR